MSDTSLDRAPNERFREIVDWTIFGLGVLSLTIAVTATVLTKIGDQRSDARPAAQTDRLTG